MDERNLNVSLASFWTPEYLPVSAWIGHAPFAFWLVERLKPSRFVELGTHHGYSYFAICQAISRLDLGTTAYAIDTWKGDEHAGLYGDDVFRAVETHNARYAHFSTLIRRSFDDAVEKLDDQSIDLLHIDGRHRYEDVRHDYETWSPKLTQDAVVLFHDTNVRQGDFGVWQFFGEIARQHPSFTFLHSSGLGVLCPSGSVPEPLRALLDSDVASIDATRLAYASLGEAAKQRQAVQATRSSIDAMLRPDADLTPTGVTAIEGMFYPGVSIGPVAALVMVERSARLDAERRAKGAQDAIGAAQLQAEAEVRAARQALRQAVTAAESDVKAAQDATGAAQSQAEAARNALRQAVKTAEADLAAARKAAQDATGAARSQAEADVRAARVALREAVMSAESDLAAARKAAQDATGAAQWQAEAHTAALGEISRLRATTLLGEMARRALTARGVAQRRTQVDADRFEGALARCSARSEGLRRLLVVAETRQRRQARFEGLLRRVVRAKSDAEGRAAAMAGWGHAGREQLGAMRERLVRGEARQAALERHLSALEGSRPWRAFARLRALMGRPAFPVLPGAADTSPDGDAMLIEQALETGLFDAAYYLETNPDVAEQAIDPALHFMQIGWREGRNPSPAFDTAFYLDRYPDVAAADVNPLVHYAELGILEGRRGTPDEGAAISHSTAAYSIDEMEIIRAVHETGLFDADYYKAAYPDIAEADLSPLAHFALTGWREGRNPNAAFDLPFYLAENPDVAALGTNPLLHYFEAGLAEGRPASPRERADRPAGGIDPGHEVRETGIFDADFYLAASPDVAAAGVNPSDHFAESGWHEGRNPNGWFETAAYLASYPDVVAAGVNPLIHYARAGAAEGREPRPVPPAAVTGDRGSSAEEARLVAEVEDTGLFDAAFYRATYPDVVAASVDPVLHFALLGWREGRKPGPDFDPSFYLDQNPDVAAAGVNPLVHFATSGLIEGRLPYPAAPVVAVVPAIRDRLEASLPLPAAPVVDDLPASPTSVPPALTRVSARSLIKDFGRQWRPLPVFSDRGSTKTLTILTDSVDTHSLFGGVGTALVLGALLAERMGARLRLATITNPPDPLALGHVLEAHRIVWTGPTDFSHIPLDGSKPLAVGNDDVVLTTSWWTTRSARASLPPEQIVYLLQEDERMFYPFGDVRLRCVEMLSDPEIRTIVNTELLFDHLCRGDAALDQFERRAVWFDPAFPSIPRERSSTEDPSRKRNFFFYSRPNHARNLYWRGLETVDRAIRDGILKADDWNFHFVGSPLPPMEVGGVVPENIAKLPWLDYAALMTRMDLGLCLMDTPHPSYPPLDLAAAGSVVVTNTHGMKQSLHGWSRNILSSPPRVVDLMQALRDGVSLARDDERRTANFKAQRIPRDWRAQMMPAIDRLLSKAG